MARTAGSSQHHAPPLLLLVACTDREQLVCHIHALSLWLCRFFRFFFARASDFSRLPPTTLGPPTTDSTNTSILLERPRIGAQLISVTQPTPTPLPQGNKGESSSTSHPILWDGFRRSCWIY